LKTLSIKKLFTVTLAAWLVVVGCTPKIAKKEVIIDDFRPTGILEKSLPEIAEALNNGEITSESLVKLYLERIDAVDKNGPTLQSILSLNPDAIKVAKKLDMMRKNGTIKGPLHGIPILLKDNIESKDNIATTAGALALKNNITGRDSPLVAGLRAQGAIILGKTNLSQWANFRSEGSMSGWTALGGQVRNPHMLDRNPCGSSSGSGAAAAASLASGTVGTETNGSITCPSNANGVVGFKPTVGIVPQQYIIPISVTQDTAGPMTKTVMGAAMMMNAMATETPNVDYTAALNKDSLKGVRIGVLNFANGSSVSILKLFERAQKDLKAAGAILVDINDQPVAPDEYGQMAYDLLKYEFKDGINEYLASTSTDQVKTRTLKELIEFNEEHADIELALFDQSIFTASEKMESLESDVYKKALDVVLKTSREEGVDKLLTTHNVSALIAPTGPVVPRVDPLNGDVWPNSWPGFGSYTARAGYPHATVPMGGIKSLSIGLSIIGGKNSDASILAYAYAYEQKSLRRLEPQYLKNAEARPDISKLMKPYKSESK
jgi:amidase